MQSAYDESLLPRPLISALGVKILLPSRLLQFNAESMHSVIKILLHDLLRFNVKSVQHACCQNILLPDIIPSRICALSRIKILFLAFFLVSMKNFYTLSAVKISCSLAFFLESTHVALIQNLVLWYFFPRIIIVSVPSFLDQRFDFQVSV